MTGAQPKPSIIDVHTHIYPETYLALLESRRSYPRVARRNGAREFVIFAEEDGPNGTGGRAMGSEFWDLGEKRAFMDRFGITRSVVSLGNPWFDPFPGAEALAVVRQVNRELARYAAATGGRVVGIGALPTSSVEAAAEALGEIAGLPGLYGVSSGPEIAGRAFDDPAVEVVWRELARLDLPLFVHPVNGVAPEALTGYLHALPIGIGFPVETTVAITRLVFSGVLERYPQLRILAAHGGGVLPFLAGRLDAAWRSDPSVRARLAQPPSAYFRMLYLDALVYYGPAFGAAMRLVGSERLFFGTDHPFSVSDPQANLTMIADETAADPRAQRAVLGTNAERFFQLPALASA